MPPPRPSRLGLPSERSDRIREASPSRVGVLLAAALLAGGTIAASPAAVPGMTPVSLLAAPAGSDQPDRRADGRADGRADERADRRADGRAAHPAATAGGTLLPLHDVRPSAPLAIAIATHPDATASGSSSGRFVAGRPAPPVDAPPTSGRPERPVVEPVAEPPPEDDVFVAADGERVTAERIRTFLEGRGAPLEEQADALVAAGIEHDVDPRLVVGIAVAESSGGERLPSGSHNAWGWGGSGSFGLAHWPSWEVSIDVYTERLGALYDTGSVDERFARTYCPPNWRWWLDTVTWVMDTI